MKNKSKVTQETLNKAFREMAEKKSCDNKREKSVLNDRFEIETGAKQITLKNYLNV